MQVDVWQRGVDLFNAGRFFDAHESLEDLWREAALTPRKTHLQGLVQLAVAFHHQSTGNWEGATSVLERALLNLEGAEESFPELDLESLRDSLNPWREYLALNRRGAVQAPPALPKLLPRVGGGDWTKGRPC